MITKFAPGTKVWHKDGVFVNPVQIIPGFHDHRDFVNLERLDECHEEVKKTSAHVEDLYDTEIDAVNAALDWALVSVRSLNDRRKQLEAKAAA